MHYNRLWFLLTLLSPSGHDGESPVIPFVEFGKPPITQKERLAVLEMMYWNAMFCASGDHTLAAAHHAIKEVVKEEGNHPPTLA